MRDIRLRLLACLSVICRIPMMRGRLTLGEALFSALAPRETLVSMRVGQHRIRLDLAEKQARFIYFSGYERSEIRFLRQVLKPGDIVLDVGAHVGYLAAVMAERVRPTGRVYALEPDSRNYARLNEAACQSGVIAPFRVAAVGPGCGSRVTFYGSRSSSMWSSLRPEIAGADSVAEEVPALTIDAFLRSEGIALTRLRLVKIDVEGAEAAVLNGMEACLSSPTPPTILCELKPAPASNRIGSACTRLLGRHGYEAFLLGPSGRLLPIENEELERASRTLNAIFLPTGVRC